MTYTTGVNPDGTCKDGPHFWLSDADQMFPLWGFDPRHKDAFVEIDLNHETVLDLAALIDGRAVRSNTCLQGAASCGPDGSVLWPTVINDRLHPWDLAHDVSSTLVLQQLNVWRDAYARLGTNRVNNPDGRNGIELHFDALGHPTQSNGHGFVPQFDVMDSGGVARPGLIVYAPAGQLGSGCSCRGARSCPNPRHAGYVRYARLDSFGGGGQSDCNSLVQGGITAGTTAAHEMGHHLGLRHGGPRVECAGSNYTGGATERNSADLLNEGKLVHYSNMNYVYGQAPFSHGERMMTPLPRATTPAGPIGYPEVAPVASVSTRFMREFGTLPPEPFPSGCETGGTSPVCTDADFDRDGAAATALVNSFIEREPSAWRRGRHVAVAVPGNWCPEEQRSTLNTHPMCCDPTASTLQSGMCQTAPPGTTPFAPTNLPTSNTALLMASPAVAIANGRAYAFFVDDMASGDATEEGNLATSTQSPGYQAATRLPRRCTRANEDASLCSDVPVMFGKLRWVALADRFRFRPRPDLSLPPGQRSTAAFATGRRLCAGETSDCTEPLPGRPEYGTVTAEFISGWGITADGPATVQGTTRIAATTLRDASGADSRVLLAWTNRTGVTCAPLTDGCRNLWLPAEVRIVDVAALESGTFTLAANNGRFQLPVGATVGTGFSDVTMVPWSPGPTGERSRTEALVFLRSPRGNGNGGQVWYSVCQSSGACGVLAPVLDSVGNPLLSFTSISASLANPPDGSTMAGSPSVALVYGVRAAATDTFATPRLMKFDPDGSGGITQPFPYRLEEPNPDPSMPDIPLTVEFESAVSIAFTDSTPAQGSRMILTYEGFEYNANGQATVQTTTTAWPFSGGSGSAVLCIVPAAVAWGNTRPWVGARDSMGQWISARADGPGHIPTPFFDERTGLAILEGPRDAQELQYLERNVRAAQTVQAQAGPQLLLTAIYDPRPVESHFDYDEVSAMGTFLCPTTHASGRGLAFPDIQARSGVAAPNPMRGPPAFCPGTLAQGRSSSMVMHISSSILSECSGDCLRNSPPDSVFDQIAAALIAPGNFAQLPTSSADSGSLAHSPPHRQGTTCASENPDALWLYSHPDNQ